MMGNVEAEKITAEDSYESSYNTFIFCLEALASSVDVACDNYGNYNVAWEIKDDVSAGVYLKNNPAHRLSEQQIVEIENLANALSTLPESVARFTNIIEDSLKNMNVPAWVPIRRMAAQLLESLQAAQAGRGLQPRS